MTQKTREEYEMDLKDITDSSLLETSHRMFETLKVIARILLDVRETLITKEPDHEDKK